MMEHPVIGIALLTYRRTEEALQTIRAAIENMQTECGLLWYVADDGSSEAHVRAILEPLGGRLIGWHSQRMGPGPSWNKAVAAIADITPFIFWLEDDWELRRPLDLDPYVALLQDVPSVGMVRLGHLPTGLVLESTAHDGRHYLRVLKDRQYTYSGNPSLRHFRHFAAYGGYPMDQRPAGECELYHDHFVRSRDGPEIWWPVDLGGWGIFGHIGKEKA